MTKRWATETRLAKMHPGRGVVVNYLEYWSERLLDPDLANKMLRVRFNRLDVSTVFVEIDGAWVECYCRHYAEMKEVSVAQVKIAMRERRKAVVRINNARIMALLDDESQAERQLQPERQRMTAEERIRRRPKKEGS
jgi:hypothetical protein